MTSQGNGQPSIYQVHMSEQTRALLKDQQREAAQAGGGEQFLSALRVIGERLRTDPLTFGEPKYHLTTLKLLVCQAVVAPIIVEYAVHQERPLIFIRGFKFLS